VPLSNLTGLGGFTNGEIARVSGRTPKLYRARLFLRETWGLGGVQEAVGADMNQLAGSVDKRRFVVTTGNLSVLDIFDDNTYSHDPRTQFLNWSLMTHGAFDYAADARGYSWGVATEYYHDDWTVRAGRFIQPREPNQLSLDPKILQHYGDQLEFERRHELRAQPGAVRVLFFRNRARMSRFADAKALRQRTVRRRISTWCDLPSVKYESASTLNSGFRPMLVRSRALAGPMGRPRPTLSQRSTIRFQPEWSSKALHGDERRTRLDLPWFKTACQAPDRATLSRAEWVFSLETERCDTDARTSGGVLQLEYGRSGFGGPLIFSEWSTRPITRTADLCR
jgi:hypothetical protein